MAFGHQRHVVNLDVPNGNSGASGVYRDQVLADGAVLYLRLDETYGSAVNSLVGGYHGVISGGVTLNQPGALADGNPAMAFDGTTGKIEIPMSTLAASFTIEAWIKIASTTVLLPFWSNRDTGGGNSVFAGVMNRTPLLFINGAGGNTLFAGLRIVCDDVWHHVAYTNDGNLSSNFVDGVLDVGAFAQSRVAVSKTSRVAHDIEGASFWPGLIDDVAIYSTALTPQQIANHYALGAPASSYTPLDPPTWYCAIVNETAGNAMLAGHYHAGITTATRVHLRGRTYHVKNVINRAERDLELVLDCAEVFD